MIEYKITTPEDIDLLMASRLVMLREVNHLAADYEYSEELKNCSRDYFLNGDQTTVLALDGGKVAGCASISYITIMPTFSHATGKRSHLMNVYTDPAYRGQGIARKMVEMLIEDAWSKGATEISLDATTMGRPLYEKLGFKASTEAMVLNKDGSTSCCACSCTCSKKEN
ncbi:MAG: GNAT family N-acetyltransferase [Firmicutes bacterium]|nr:GNAT family N-acetyltransferase [Bacillota bacterium]